MELEGLNYIPHHFPLAYHHTKRRSHFHAAFENDIHIPVFKTLCCIIVFPIGDTSQIAGTLAVFNDGRRAGRKLS